MAAGRFVLENPNGEVVRTFALAGDEVFIVYRHDTRRVEVVSSLAALKEEKVSYDLLKKTSTGSVKKRSVGLDNGSRFRFTDDIQSVVGSVQILDDSEDEEKKIYQYTAFTQVGAIALVFIIGLLIEPLFMSKTEAAIVTVIPQ